MMGGIWAAVPIKDTTEAKQRLAETASPKFRQALALAMAEDVLAALAEVRGVAGIVVVTVDEAAKTLAARYGARIQAEGALDGHTGAVTAAARRLAADGAAGMLTVPGDIPLTSAAEIGQVIAAHRPAPSFTIVPAHDEQGSNAILMSPPDAVPLRFGDNSFFPHLAAAEACGITPTVVRLPGIGFDIDNPVDLAHFSRLGSETRAGKLLAGGVR
ncbi:MAG TPA: 2-phospho-L-lactate guanylyltransferase [Stellaceae bacterium]|nr:2-phospho-L-lactate guanylyltransferase [Stellaceae bacterium]